MVTPKVLKANVIFFVKNTYMVCKNPVISHFLLNYLLFLGVCMKDPH